MVVARLLPVLLFCAFLAAPPTQAQLGPPFESFAPKSGKPAPVVVILSGASGTTPFRNLAAEVSDLGYLVALVDGNAILTWVADGEWNLRQVIARAQASPDALPGKVVVLGFSQGGGGALAHAVVMPELVSGVVAYYPAINWVADNLPALAARIKVPVLVFAGEADRFNDCCLVKHMRELAKVAKAKRVPLELVVYRGAKHGFNMPGDNFQASASDDAWRRTKEVLAKHLPLQP